MGGGRGSTFPIRPKSLCGRHSTTLMISVAENDILGYESGILLWRPDSLKRGGFIERVHAVLTINRPLCEECAVIKFEWAPDMMRGRTRLKWRRARARYLRAEMWTEDA
ncbi:hypothetical protein CDAR_448641 [Caerostris darwini]|uniref:Uncharacterized protein n=1 Tax=Caerostris darwini TaxID=1538125 RepID=A0AAV4QM42_9ARAC|nr:hypothetical protein CDAR_448641 [Caerostris darwini]